MLVDGSLLLHLAEMALAHAYRLTHLAQTGSTNDEALNLARNGDPGRLWIVADAQAKGRGRHGRQWVSPPGNLYASLLLIDPAPAHKAPELGFVTGVAVWHALRDVLGDDPLLAIKWPNDILYAGAKLAGILLESTCLNGSSNGFEQDAQISLRNLHRSDCSEKPVSAFSHPALACVIGIGVNCNSHPAAAAYPATDLAEIGTLLADREDVLIRLSDRLVEWLRTWDKGRNFAAIRGEWLRHAAGIGTRISVAASAGPLEGIFETIDAAGRLVLNADGQRLTVEAGDVFLAAARSGASAGAGSAFTEAVSHEGQR